MIPLSPFCPFYVTIEARRSYAADGMEYSNDDCTLRGDCLCLGGAGRIFARAAAYQTPGGDGARAAAAN